MTAANIGSSAHFSETLESLQNSIGGSLDISKLHVTGMSGGPVAFSFDPKTEGVSVGSLKSSLLLGVVTDESTLNKTLLSNLYQTSSTPVVVGSSIVKTGLTPSMTEWVRELLEGSKSPSPGTFTPAEFIPNPNIPSLH